MKKHRQIENIQRDIDGAKKWLAELVREKVSAERSARMKILRHHPDFIAKMNGGLQKAYLDPEWCARVSAKKSANARRKAILPPMDDRQRRYYRKLRYHGTPRWEAVDAALQIRAAE